MSFSPFFRNAFVLCLLVSSFLSAFTIDRAIISSDTNPNYIQFWPLVAKAWKKLGIKPTLALIAEDGFVIEDCGAEVIRFKPIPGVSTAMQAQTIRLLLPAVFPEEHCILSDVDMIPISKSYFQGAVRGLPEESFVVFRDHAYAIGCNRYPMCYVAAKGKLYGRIFGVASAKEIPEKIKEWANLNYGWETDEIVLRAAIDHSEEAKKLDVIRLGHKVEGRVDRENWQLDPREYAKGKYIDAHCLRPYVRYKKEIDSLLSLMGIETELENDPVVNES